MSDDLVCVDACDGSAHIHAPMGAVEGCGVPRCNKHWSGLLLVVVVAARPAGANPRPGLDGEGTSVL